MELLSYKDFFAGKRITLMGLGLLGRGVGDAAFLAPLCKELVVTDRKSKEELAESLTRLESFPNIRFALGGHTETDFTDTDMVIKAAGVPLTSPYIAAARAAGVPVYMSTALAAQFAKDAGATIVGITGTRGKSTTTHLIYHTLVAAGVRTHLGGNVRGLSTLAMIPEVQSGDIVVLELDSWQLQGFGDLHLSPDVAVFTNLMPDHLNYYPSMEEYFADKANIFTYQSEPAVIAGPSIAERIPNVRLPSPLPPTWRLKIVGDHNKENAALAAEALRLLGLTEEQIQTGVESFDAVEGRLQFVREIGGVKIYNDNNATTPDATIAAIKALDEGKKNIIVIMGGADKGLDFSALWPEVLAKCKGVFFLAGSGTDRIRPDAPQVPVYNSIPEALKDAYAAAEAGDVILFSPAFASFGMFTNEYDRNDQFVTAVKQLV